MLFWSVQCDFGAAVSLVSSYHGMGWLGWSMFRFCVWRFVVVWSWFWMFLAWSFGRYLSVLSSWHVTTPLNRLSRALRVKGRTWSLWAIVFGWVWYSLIPNFALLFLESYVNKLLSQWCLSTHNASRPPSLAHPSIAPPHPPFFKSFVLTVSPLVPSAPFSNLKFTLLSFTTRPKNIQLVFVLFVSELASVSGNVNSGGLSNLDGTIL